MAMAIAADSVFKKIVMRGNNYFKVLCRITPSGNYASLGDVLDFKPLGRTSTKQPRLVTITGNSGYVYQYDLTNKKVKVFVATTSGANIPLAEHTAAAYAAGVTSDVIIAEVMFANA